MTRKELLDSLASEVCPHCGAPKTPRMTFCRKDYYALPKEMRQALYHRFGKGYEPAFHAALARLQASQLAQTRPPTPATTPPQHQPTLFRDEGGANWIL